MSEEQPVQELAQEVATESQDQPSKSSPDVGELIAENKKYRTRAQKVESKLSKLQDQIESDRQSQLEKQEEWQTLAEERKIKLDAQDEELAVVRAERKAEFESLLTDFSEEEREELKGLTLQSLKMVHNKLITNSRSQIPNVNNSKPITKSDPNIGDWTKLDPKVKRDNWQGIVDSFKRK